MQPSLRVPGVPGSTQVPCAEISCREGERAETESRRWLRKDCHGEQRQGGSSRRRTGPGTGHTHHGTELPLSVREFSCDHDAGVFSVVKIAGALALVVGNNILNLISVLNPEFPK